MQGKQQSADWRKQTLYIVNSEYINTTVTGHRGINFLNDYDEADEEGRRWLSLVISKWIIKIPVLKKKTNILFNTGGSLRHHNNCGSTHPSMAASKESKFPPSFSGFNSQKFIHESSYDGVSGKDYRTMMNSRYIDNWASVFHLWLLEVFSWFQNGSILLVNAELS